ncbi:hypothetical protein glysoja_021806 [Glycine soja]|nr:hypothetical protein glysoja_021806 [Glycine soja]
MEFDEKKAMIRDVALQVVFISLTIFSFLWMHGIPQNLYAKLRHRPPNPRAVQAKRHFVKGAQLLAQARRSKSASSATSLAKQALAEAEKAIALDPKDAASHLLKRRVDSVLADLTESVKLSPRNAKAWCMLGETYEGNKMGEEAKKAYKEALELEPQLNVAQEALSRLGSS